MEMVRSRWKSFKREGAAALAPVVAVVAVAVVVEEATVVVEEAVVVVEVVEKIKMGDPRGRLVLKVSEEPSTQCSRNSGW